MKQLPVAFVAAVVLAVCVAPAPADPPYPDQFPVEGYATLNDTCAFPVDVAFRANVTAKYFFVKGVLTKLEWHVVEQDTFSAGGVSLTSLPYVFNMQILFDSAGAVTRHVTQGAGVRVPLPDGSVFLTAGRIDWFVKPGYPYVDYVLVPDNGATVNLEGFCAALE
jgi:hypothetical protein